MLRSRETLSAACTRVDASPIKASVACPGTREPLAGSLPRRRSPSRSRLRSLPHHKTGHSFSGTAAGNRHGNRRPAGSRWRNGGVVSKTTASETQAIAPGAGCIRASDPGCAFTGLLSSTTDLHSSIAIGRAADCVAFCKWYATLRIPKRPTAMTLCTFPMRVPRPQLPRTFCCYSHRLGPPCRCPAE
jgi:hypothetical protein